jgi:small-conductance mechanosensitive channel
MTEHQKTTQNPQEEAQKIEQQLAQLEDEARRLRRELEAVEHQGAQGSAVRGELQQTDETIDSLRQRLDTVRAQAAPPSAQPPERTPLTGGRGIAIGGVAWLAQEGGPSSHLRTHPHFEYGEDKAHLETGMQCTVVDGPEHEEGYTWWRVRLSDGQEGWVVDEGLMGQSAV